MSPALAPGSHPIPFLLPSLLFVGSICDLIQFTNVGENCQWRGSARPFHSFNNSEPGDQFSLLRELQTEPSGTWSCLHWGWQQNSTWCGCCRSSLWAPVLHVVIWNSPGISFVPPWSEAYKYVLQIATCCLHTSSLGKQYFKGLTAAYRKAIYHKGDVLHQRQCSANATSEINFPAVSWFTYNQGHVSCNFLPLLFLVERICLMQS